MFLLSFLNYCLRVIIIGEVDDPVGLLRIVPELIPEPVQGFIPLDHAPRLKPEKWVKETKNTYFILFLLRMIHFCSRTLKTKNSKVIYQ
jgi:hypothetical protein